MTVFLGFFMYSTYLLDVNFNERDLVEWRNPLSRSFHGLQSWGMTEPFTYHMTQNAQEIIDLLQGLVTRTIWLER